MCILCVHVRNFCLVVICRKLSIGVCSSDLNYMPQVVVVQGGKRMDNMTDLNTVREYFLSFLL